LDFETVHTISLHNCVKKIILHLWTPQVIYLAQWNVVPCQQE